MKKAQLTIFMILGFVILVSFGFIFIISTDQKIETPYPLSLEQEKIEISLKTEECIKIQAKEAINLYGIDASSNKEIAQYIEKNLQACANPSLWEEKGLDIEEGTIQSESLVSVNSMLIRVKYPVRLEKEKIATETSDYFYSLKVKENRTLPVDMHGFMVRDSIFEMEELGAKLEIKRETFVKDLSNLKKGDESLPNAEYIYFEARSNKIVDNMDLPVSNLIYNLGFNDTWFYPAARLTLSYRNIKSDVKEDDLRILYYSYFLDEWIELKTDIDKNEKTLSADIYHLTPFAIGTKSQIKEDFSVYYNKQESGMGQITGEVILNQDLQAPSESQIEDIKKEIKEKFTNAPCDNSGLPDAQCTMFYCNAYLKGFPTERCYKFQKTDVTKQQCPGNKILVPWHCPGDNSVRCCVRPEVFHATKQLAEQSDSIPPNSLFGILNSYDSMSNEQKINYILSRIEGGKFLELEKNEAFMLSTMAGELIKEITDNNEQSKFERNKLRRLAIAVNLVKHRLIRIENDEIKNRISNQNMPGYLWNGGNTNVTKYYTSYEGDFGGDWATFAKDVRMQGSGVGINKDRVYRYNTIKELKEASPSIPCFGISCNGITASGTPPIVGRTIAVPRGIFGQNVYVDFGADYREWNGCYKGEDVGGAIVGNHIDFYSGVGKSELASVRIPGNANVYIGC